MIKVIVGYKIKEGADIQPVILKLRSHAITYPGYVGAENLASFQDKSIVASISTWQKPEDWFAWRDSKVAQTLWAEVTAFLVEEPQVTIYRVMPTVDWPV